MRKSNCLAMILAGGKGSRLGVLTKDQAKPGLLFGGKYRIIDFTLSNCRHSGIGTVGILTQYQPLELNWYVGNGSSWDLDSDTGGTFVLPPYTNDAGSNWYRGTADAIYQNLNFVDMIGDDYVLILSGDHIYSMNYAKMLAFHKKHEAAVTIGTIRVPWDEASRFGIMVADDNMRITKFQEKPKQPESNLASMGIYIFNRTILEDYLKADAADENSEHDFGKNVIPAMLRDQIALYAYPFEGYWKDVGTIDSLWQANMDLLADDPPLDLSDTEWRVYSANQSMPPHYIGPKGSVTSSLIAEGAAILGQVSNSVIFYGVTVEEGAKVVDSVVMPGTVIEKNAVVDKAIIGEDCTVHSNAVVHHKDGTVAVFGRHTEVAPQKNVKAAKGDE
ncbi:glucose-1-phosphate adenylyltransferase [Megasphaera hominis]|jgi:glucose-1-phosphate adenylyltransferase|uniref:Glucose-1-phosphate adenylyltransferase n=2 Tax=Megasphaera TaxID=906 RepID=A0ABR6VK33_9FIRM|nr:glucose-1-phosphate adenylyltransferase [Megasphaera hominis]MBC3537574.1 glucose-1-phosphate adenylyltransferase [Megasphaera hominis]